MLEISSPIPKQTVGRTFVIALGVLGAVAFVQFCALGWAFLKGPRPVEMAGAPVPVKLADPFATAATSTAPHAPEIPRELPKPHPVDLFTRPQPAETLKPVQAVATPNPAPPSAPVVRNDVRVNELVEAARALRARGDTAATLTRLREAAAIAPDNASVLFELAMTYEKTGLADKAAEHWRKIYDLGESSGPFYTAAESKMRAAEAMAKLNTAQQAPATAAPAPAPVLTEQAGFQPGASLALADVVLTPQTDANSMQKLLLRVPLKSRPNMKIDVRDVIIHVDFYDSIETQNVVRTNANVSSRWTTLPVDWAEDDLEVLEVEYSQPKMDPKRAAENRKFFGYIIRVYYKTELQDMRASPVSLLKQYPPPLKLADEEPK